MPDKIRIMVADDHPAVRSQLVSRLSREPEFEIVCEAASSVAAIECGLKTRPQIVLIDPIMRDGYGLQAIQRLTGDMPGCAIIVLTAFTDTAMNMALNRLGVARILAKDLDLQQLILSLRTIGQALAAGEGKSPAPGEGED